VALIRLCVAISLATATVVLSACGAEDLSPETIANAAKATSEAGGSRMEMNLTMATPGGEDIEMTGQGVMDMAGKRGRLTVDLSQVPGGQGELEQVFDGFVIWMRMPVFEGQLPDGKSWVRLDIEEVSKEYGVDISQFPQAGNDPTKMLDYMRAAGDVEKEGEEGVRGVPTTHYAATVDFRDYPELAPESQRAEAEKSIDRLIELAGQHEFDVEVWIGNDDLVRRMRMEMPMNPPGGQDLDMVIDYELYDFGTDVDIAPPPADDVVDYSEIAPDASQLQAP
jgi:hypothetical protein